MFFDGEKKESLVTPFFVSGTDFKEVHYKSVSVTDKTPFLFTTNLTFCVGIGFKHYAEEKSVDKIALYHSVSEHGLQCSEPEFIKEALKTKHLVVREEKMGQNFVRAVYDFLKPVSDSKKIEVILHFNKTCINLYDADCDSVHETLKAVWKYLHPSDKSEVQFNIKFQTGGSTFTISNQAGATSNDSVLRAICYRIAAYVKESSWLMHHRCVGIIDQAEKEKYSWQLACEKICEHAKNISSYERNNKIYYEINRFIEELNAEGLIKLKENHHDLHTIKYSS